MISRETGCGKAVFWIRIHLPNQGILLNPDLDPGCCFRPSIFKDKFLLQIYNLQPGFRIRIDLMRIRIRIRIQNFLKLRIRIPDLDPGSGSRV
jgi:hypothetical protein